MKLGARTLERPIVLQATALRSPAEVTTQLTAHHVVGRDAWQDHCLSWSIPGSMRPPTVLCSSETPPKVTSRASINSVKIARCWVQILFPKLPACSPFS